MVFAWSSGFAQGIYGRVLDEKKQPIGSAIVQAFQGGIVKGGAATDYEGNFEIKPLESGYYFLVVTYLGYDTEKIKDVVVPPNDDIKVDFSMSPHAVEANVKKPIIVRAYKKPLVGTLDHTMTAEEIKTMPTSQIADAAATSPGSYQQKRGGEINMSGARVEGTLYIIDGVQVQYIAGNRSGVDLASGSVEQMEVSPSGIEAKYGDVSGGVVNITTKGATQKYAGGVTAEHSLDGYNNSMVNVRLSGPIWKQAIKGDSNHTKKPVMGFSLNAEYHEDHNRYPSYFGDYVVKSDVLNKLQAKPLTEVVDNTGAQKFFLSSQYIDASDLQTTKVPPHDNIKEWRLNGKINYQPEESISVVAGGNLDYVTKDLYDRQMVLFSPQGIPTQNNFSGRAFLRFTQKFGKSNDTAKGIVSNAYYTVQADIQRESTEDLPSSYGKNFFRYNYIGKFNQTYQSLYLPGQKDSASGRTGTVLIGSQSNGYTFAPSGDNPLLANYTSELYGLTGNNPLSLTQIRNYNGVINGDGPAATYSINGGNMYYSPGSSLDPNYTQYSYFKSDQYSLSVDASFDLKTGPIKHAIQFGMYYQQRVVSSYNINPTALWNLMRGGAVASVSNGGLYLDKTNPYFIVGGKKYSLSDINNGVVIPSATDTIVYNYVNSNNSVFDANLRKKLGYTNTQDINIDAVNPDLLSVSMFSADQILNSGHQIASYYGMTYADGQQNGNVNFNDFWTKKDANGNYTRPIGAFTPNYVAGYIQDKFRYENIKFNVGVRIDRYSSNTKVLIDPYSELPERTVGQVAGNQNEINGGSHPSNMGGNYVVYVDDNTSSNPQVIGYRSGNNWYDPKGNFIEDPSVLKQYSGGRDPQPYIQAIEKNTKITDSSFNPNLSFTDYTPQVTIMPRIQFAFPISEVADFFAHYDIYAQRPYPNSVAISTPATYYFLQANNTSVVPNANLLPSKTYDYEVGFQQKLSDHSAMTITGFYKERKNMVTVVPYLYAWPTTYYTYGNRDFSTTKGSTLNFDFRTTNHLRMNISYTLQFAEGTGSTPLSTTSGTGSTQGGILQSFIQAGLPNLRYVTSLDYDARHTFTANVDYRYREGEGPIVGGNYILQNAGVDFIARARSGEPYTAYSLPDNVGHTVIGGINGSRLPWHYGLDMRLDKDLKISFGGRKGAVEGMKVRQPKYVKVYMYVQNLLNIQDVTGVYGYTGKSNDDGYLASSFGQQYVPQQVSPKSFAALYNIYVNNPDHYNYARTINFGMEFNF